MAACHRRDDARRAGGGAREVRLRSEHFRPYFFTQNLRYSYGCDKGRQQDAWQRVIVGMTPAEQVAALEKYGSDLNTSGPIFSPRISGTPTVAIKAVSRMHGSVSSSG